MGMYLEVVDNALSVEEVVRDREEIPVEGFAPWITTPCVDLPDILPLQREQGCDLTIHQRLA